MDKPSSKAIIEPLMEEPWVYLANGGDLSSWVKEDEIAYNQANRQMGKYQMFVSAMDFIGENRVHGDYFEFGCHRCRTFRMALTEARRHNLDDMNFLAFDSFEGLPEVQSAPSVDIWKQGVLATSENQFMSMINDHGIYTDKVRTIKGYYDASLTDALKAELVAEGRKIALVNIDCDLYESAVPVFDFIEPFLQEGTLIYMDDLFCGYKGSPHKGVAKAFLEFQQRSEYSFQPHMNVGWWGRTYIAYLPEKGLDGGIV